MNFFLLKEYLQYFHLATDEHSLHSPFFYDFYIDLIKRNKRDRVFQLLERERDQLKKNQRTISLLDYGAGSKVSKSKSRTVASIANSSLSTAKFSSFLFNLVKKYNYKTVIELGTSLGINTSYLSIALQHGQLCTFEGDPSLMAIAKKINQQNTNISFVEGNIDETLPNAIEKLSSVDLVYADANHTYEATLSYFDQISPFIHPKSIYIVDDIHWSAGMKKAWEMLKTNQKVTASVDIFDAGLLFFDPDLVRDDFVLDF